ncbi:MAG: cytochrome C, partial [Pseudomonadota bacterium]
KNVQCLRGAMFNGGMLCSDCHGSMAQVGADFSEGVSPANPGDFKLTGLGNFYNPADPQPRTPWANEPGCGSCHTGDAMDNLSGTPDMLVNSVDSEGNDDGIRLRQAFLTSDAKATPIVPTNKRFAEPVVPASFNGFANPGAGNPQLYRVSTGHEGVFCEGCHGATHAEWPNANPDANDNVTANQLQGHTGTITECSTCHDPAAFEDSGAHELTMEGPHGMHPVGSVHWNTHHKEARVQGGDNCRTCHGPNGEGTVLSRMSADRMLECKDDKGDFCPGEGQTLFPRGHVVGCDDCHQNHL